MKKKDSLLLPTVAQLLRDAYQIHDKYESLMLLSGERFNIFKLLNVHTNEVATHTRLIAELLNPKGSHGMGKVFLELFVQQLGLRDFDCDKALVKREKGIGKVSGNNRSGGSIDLYISDGIRAIVIENKIYASDQKNQLLRYAKFAKKRHDVTHVYYLTLHGSKASKYSTSGETEYQCLSYKSDILNWIEQCREKGGNHPRLRETLTQYIYVIKELTYQTHNQIMVEEIVNRLTESTERLKAFFSIKKAEVSMQKRMLDKFKRQMEELSKEFKLEPHFDEKFGLRKDPNYLKFFFPNSSKGFHIKLCFHKRVSGLMIQVDSAQDQRAACKDSVLKVLPLRGDKCNEIWIHRFEEEGLYNWSNVAEPWVMILDGRMKKFMKDWFVEIVEGMKKVEM